MTQQSRPKFVAHSPLAPVTAYPIRMSALGPNGPDGPEIRLPLSPRKRTQVGHRAIPFRAKFRHRATHSITSSARTIDFVAVLPERLIRGKRRNFRVSEPFMPTASYQSARRNTNGRGF